MKVVSQQAQRGILKTPAPQLNKWTLKGLGRDVTSTPRPAAVGVWWVLREGAAESGQAHVLSLNSSSCSQCRKQMTIQGKKL